MATDLSLHPLHSTIISLELQISHCILFLHTGIRFNHEEFEGRARYDNFDPIDEVTGSNRQGRDCDGHGTHIAALVAGKTFGAAKGARVFSTRVLDCDGDSQYSTIVLGINHVIEVKSRRRNRRIIINMSLGGPPSQATLDAVRAATNEGILVVVSAGNDFTDACRLDKKYNTFVFRLISNILQWILANPNSCSQAGSTH